MASAKVEHDLPVSSPEMVRWAVMGPGWKFSARDLNQAPMESLDVASKKELLETRPQGQVGSLKHCVQRPETKMTPA